jgi:hypothetical protein
VKKLILVFAVVMALFATAGCGGKDSENSVSKLAMAKGCPGKPTKADGSGIFRASGKDCVIADNGAIVIATDQAIVAAHGDSTVDASKHVKIFVYNSDVHCNIHGQNVEVINLIKPTDIIAPPIDPSCVTLNGVG